MPRPSVNPHVLVRTKLRTPLPPRHEIPRARVVTLLDEASSKRIVCVAGRAGAGKTTAVAQWARDCAPEASWCTVDPSDNVLSRFWRHVLAAPPLSHASGTAYDELADEGSTPDFVARLIDSLQSLTAATTVVLDDFDAVTNREVLASFDAVIDRAPAALHFVTTSREQPDLPALDHLCARGEAQVVGDEQLRLHDDEAFALLAEIGADFSDEHLAVLLARAEGWITGVRLAGLARRDRAEPIETRSDAADSHAPPPLVTHLDDAFSYLEQEVLERIPEHLLEFMLQTSVVDVVRPDLCDALIEQSGSAALMNELRHRNLFVEATPHGSDTLRYHALMRELLQAKLQRESSARHRQLHVAAAEWFERANDAANATAHWLRAGRSDLAWQRFGDTLIDQFTRGAEPAMRRWTQLIPKEHRVVPRAALGIAMAQIFLGALDQARGWVHRAETELAGAISVDPVVAARLEFVKYLLEFADGRLVSAARMGTAAHQRLTAAAPDEWERLRAPLGRARLLSLLGHHDRANEAVAGLIEWLDRDNRWIEHDRLGVAATLASIALARGEVEQAAGFAIDALARSADLADSRHSAADAHAVLGAVCFRRSDFDAARAHLETAMTLADLQSFVHLKVLPRITLVEVEHAQGRDQHATRLLAEARELLPPSARVLRQRIDDVGQRVSAEETLRVGDALTVREREVWRYLATGMSMREIAEVLFISRNTLKSHVRNIYQKLDVRNREEAVELHRRPATPNNRGLGSLS